VEWSLFYLGSRLLLGGIGSAGVWCFQHGLEVLKVRLNCPDSQYCLLNLTHLLRHWRFYVDNNVLHCCQEAANSVQEAMKEGHREDSRGSENILFLGKSTASFLKENIVNGVSFQLIFLYEPHHESGRVRKKFFF